MCPTLVCVIACVAYVSLSYLASIYVFVLRSVNSLMSLSLRCVASLMQRLFSFWHLLTPCIVHVLGTEVPH